MPPVTKAGGSEFRKDVEFVAKEDDEEQIAAGIVMVPDKVDLQYDFVREETIRTFADQFGTFVDAGEASGGIMHAAWPSDWMTLERNEVLDEAEEIGDEEAPAGAWVQEWRFNDDGLWQLVLDGIIAGYSIGAIQVDWEGPFEQSELDDVDTPEEIDDEEHVWELIEGIIREVSAVDIPAVPDAQILETKANAEKRLGDYIGDPEGFIEEAMQRGHSEDEAQRLWDELNRALEVDGSSDPGKTSMFERVGKAILSPFSGNSDADTRSFDQRAQETAKEGRTLSTSNRDSLFATIDASLDILQDANVDHGIQRFTDRDDVAFDLSEHSAREWAEPEEGEEEEEEEDEGGKGSDVSLDDDASGGDTPGNTTNMSNDNGSGDDGSGDDPDKSLAKQNAEQINELTAAVETLTAALNGEEKTVEIEIDGETHEVPKSKAKAALGVEDGDGDGDSIESLQDDVKELAGRLDSISRQSGVSDQLEASRDGGDGDEGGLDEIGKALS